MPKINYMSKLKKLEKRNNPKDFKLEDMIVDPTIRVPPNEEHRRKFAETLGVDYEELYGERTKP